MDFSPPPEGPAAEAAVDSLPAGGSTPAAGSAGNARWLLRAVQVTAALTATRLLNPLGPTTLPVAAGRSAPQSRYPLGLHQHAYGEICLCLAGEAALDIGPRRYRLRPPAVALLPPGTAHCEAYLRRDQPYSLLWLMTPSADVLASVVHYQPGAGWVFEPRVAPLPPPLAQCFPHLEALQGQTPGQALEACQGPLLSILAELHRRQKLGPGAGENRQAARPGDGQRTTGPPPAEHLVRLQQVRQFLEQHLDQPIRVSQMARLAQVSPNYLNTLFARYTGQSLHGYLTQRRMTAARELLSQGELLVKQVAARVGFSDPLYFSRAFRRYHGVFPSAVQGTGRSE